MSIEPLSHATEVQDAHYQTSRGSDQVRGLVCHDRSKDAYFHVSILPQHQKFLRFAFGGSIPISGSSIRHCTLTPHFHKVGTCTELYRRLVDIISIGAGGGSVLRCHSRPHERAGVKTKRQEKCAFSTTENHLSGRGVGFDHDAGTAVSCSDRFDPYE